MGRKISAVHGQLALMLNDLGELIGTDHPARFINDFVEMLDMKEMGFMEAGSERGSIEKTDNGRPYYGMELLLSAWLYGYFHAKRSSREIEAMCRNDVGMMWLMGRLTPDHNTLWRFWKNNRKALEEVLVRGLAAAKTMKLIGMELAALDGTKIKSLAGPDSMMSKDEVKKALEVAREETKRIMKETEAAEEREGKLGEGGYAMPKELRNAERRKQQLEEALKAIEKTERKKVCVAEPEARVMKGREGNRHSYNAQAEVDAQDQIIVGADVFTDESDYGLLAEMTQQTEETIGEKPKIVVADKGYFSSEELAKCEANKQGVLVSIPSFVSGLRDDGSDTGGPFHKSNFTYDAKRNVFVCPMGKILVEYGKPKIYRKNKNIKKKTYTTYRCMDYKECECRFKCSISRQGRTIEMEENYMSVVRQREKQADPEMKELLKLRQVIVEPVFGWMKGVHGFRRFTYMGLSKVRTQWRVMCAIVNLRTIFKAWKGKGGFVASQHAYG